MLLSQNWKKRPTKYRISKEADVSTAYVLNVMKSFEKNGWVNNTKINDAGSLFQFWRNLPDRRVYREYHIQNPESLLRSVKMDHIFTGYFAENLIGGYTFPRYYEIYILNQDINSWHSLMINNGLVGKGNVKLIISDEHVFYDRADIRGWPTVSIQQLIVDLLRTGAECAEAAEILMRRNYDADSAL